MNNQDELRSQLEELHIENARLLASLPVNTPSINRVAVKLPPFWAERPNLWFSQVDFQFAIAGITSDNTKFNCVVAQLDTRYAAEIEDIIINPPSTDRYLHLRSKLIERLSISEEQRVRQLINEEELSDRKPSQFLRHLCSLADTTILQDNMLRQLWLRRLPAHAQAILTAQSELPLDKIAEIADKIVEVSPTQPALAIQATSAPKVAVEITVLAAIEALTNQVSELCFSHQNHNRSRSRKRTDDDQSNTKGLCLYHAKFRDKATKCKSPCKYQGNSNGSQ